MYPSQGSSADALSAVGGTEAARGGLGWELQTGASVSTAGVPVAGGDPPAPHEPEAASGDAPAPSAAAG